MLINGSIAGKRLSYLRSHITIPIAQPLCSSFTIKRRFTQDETVLIKYERLPNFCYFRGRIAHENDNCEEFYEACKSHCNLHGCSLDDQCSLLPSNKYSNELRGVILNRKLIEAALQFPGNEFSGQPSQAMASSSTSQGCFKLVGQQSANHNSAAQRSNSKGLFDKTSDSRFCGFWFPRSHFRIETRLISSVGFELLQSEPDSKWFQNPKFWSN
ncbi:hypothetical protein NE237_000435 [Protea cynaroides]|uniref:Zinc knuckle CX2CX4HX4C domain-containing protein n=1 Tax=Protea cynaroides TaxID=273540 RepID=A0A9Q0QXH2_9MAGN|nr:hypothetical protein NE237_000435 [Protea cynaroides]